MSLQSPSFHLLWGMSSGMQRRRFGYYGLQAQALIRSSYRAEYCKSTINMEPISPRREPKSIESARDQSLNCSQRQERDLCATIHWYGLTLSRSKESVIGRP